MARVPDSLLRSIQTDLRNIKRLDKTVYDYRGGKDRLTRDGAAPKSGRWNTPAEIADDALKRIDSVLSSSKESGE